jgi:hypothetical protein
MGCCARHPAETVPANPCPNKLISRLLALKMKSDPAQMRNKQRTVSRCAYTLMAKARRVTRKRSLQKIANCSLKVIEIL